MHDKAGYRWAFGGGVFGVVWYALTPARERRPGQPFLDTTFARHDREGGCFITRLLDVKTRKLRTLLHPIYTLTTFNTRAFTCDRDGKHWHCLDPHGGTSHFIWRNP